MSIVNELDPNRDGKVAFSEFVQIMRIIEGKVESTID